MSAHSILRSWVGVELEAEAIRDVNVGETKIAAAQFRKEKIVPKRDRPAANVQPVVNVPVPHDDLVRIEKDDAMVLDQARKDLREQTHQYCLKLRAQASARAKEERKQELEEKRQAKKKEADEKQKDRLERACSLLFTSLTRPSPRNGWYCLLPPWLHPNRRRRTHCLRYQHRLALEKRRLAFAFHPWHEITGSVKLDDEERRDLAQNHANRRRCNSCFCHWKLRTGERYHEEARLKR